MKINTNIPFKKLANSRLFIATVAGSVGLIGGYVSGKKRGERLVNQEVLNEYPYQLELNFDAAQLADEMEIEVTSDEDDVEYDIEYEEIVAYEDGEGPQESTTKDLDELAPGLSMELDEERLRLVNKNVFHENSDGWDYAIETQNRDDSHPYIIHEDEFHAEESGFDQTSLHYYAGDNVLAEEDNTPIPDHETLLGELKFGHGSTFKNTCFVRNPIREMEYEVLRHEGTFLEEVYGNSTQEEISTEELKHSISRKFRDRDRYRDRD